MFSLMSVVFKCSSSTIFKDLNHKIKPLLKHHQNIHLNDTKNDLRSTKLDLKFKSTLMLTKIHPFVNAIKS